MQALPSSRKRQQAFTLLEMSIVIMVLLALTTMGIMTNRGMDKWKHARAGSESLRTVYTAQRMYLADHPTAVIAELEVEDLIDYLPNNARELPIVKSDTGAILSFFVKESPPYLTEGGSRYDPSGSNTDELWDAGK